MSYLTRLFCSCLILSLNRSCLPSWTDDDPIAVGYILYVCIVGGVIPLIVIMLSSILVHYERRKVNNRHYLYKINTYCVMVKI